MWIFTPIGFYSVVQKTRGTPGLCVRARDADDLNSLREVYLPELTPTETSLHTDYAYRGFCTHEEWAAALGAMARDITYDNFKNEVEDTQGKERHDVYARVWAVMLSLQKRPKKKNDYTLFCPRCQHDHDPNYQCELGCPDCAELYTWPGEPPGMREVADLDDFMRTMKRKHTKKRKKRSRR